MLKRLLRKVYACWPLLLVFLLQHFEQRVGRARSQPPLLSRMVADLHAATGPGEYTLLCEALPLLAAEHAYWTTAPKLVRVRAACGVIPTGPPSGCKQQGRPSHTPPPLLNDF